MKHITLYRVFHGIRLLRLIKIDCRETINFFLYMMISIDWFLDIRLYFSFIMLSIP